MSYAKTTATQIDRGFDTYRRQELLREEEVEHILEEAEKEIFEITSEGSGAGRLIHLGELIDEAWKRVEKLHDGTTGMRGVPTGFNNLDNKLSGFQKSDLIILAARPSVGKTSLALDFCSYCCCEAQRTHCYFLT